MENITTNKKILCVEDEKDLRENIAFFLNKQGFKIIEAGDGEEAFKKYIDEKPSLILCDINMPKMNGHDLLLKIQSQFPENLQNNYCVLGIARRRRKFLALFRKVNENQPF